MRILEVCPFSAGVCGVWTRVREEATRLAAKGHEVKVFSSHFTKGTDEVASLRDSIGSVEITRFPAKRLGGESFMHWNYADQALSFKPDLIIVHNYRQLHTTQALRIARILQRQGTKTRVFLVTHAPFVEGNVTRSLLATCIVKAYDFVIGPLTLNRFDKILTISHWERPFLEAMKVRKEKIVYIPNGIPEEFFHNKRSSEKDTILFLGRVAPKKKLETLIEAIAYLSNKHTLLEIVGPEEKEYASTLRALVSKLQLKKRVRFLPPIYGIAEKIKKLDSTRLYVLPSRVEGMPQALIEAMARTKLVIGSNSMAIRDLIQNGKNGYLFEFDNPHDLARVIDKALVRKDIKIQKAARQSVEPFAWNKVIRKIESLIEHEKPYR